jgi:hypothetical protein
MASDDECYDYESDYYDEDDMPEPDRPVDCWVRE